MGAEEIDIALVPGLAFGRDGSRLGQGGGWFDRALSGTRAVRVGVGFSFQVVASVPTEGHDLRMQWIADEEGVREV